MGYEAEHTQQEIAGPVIVYVPSTAIAAGASVSVSPTYVPLWAVVGNTGPADLIIGSSRTAVEAGVGMLLQAGQSVALRGAGALHAANPSAALAGAVTFALGLSRRPYDMPALTAAEGFPAYSGADPHAIVPGVE